MTLNLDNKDKIKSLSGNEINKVNDFKYLGSYISTTEKDLDSKELVSTKLDEQYMEIKFKG